MIMNRRIYLSLLSQFLMCYHLCDTLDTFLSVGHYRSAYRIDLFLRCILYVGNDKLTVLK